MFTKGFVYRVLCTESDDDILACYTRYELILMYEAVYDGVGYPGAWRKQDILRALRRYFAGIERARRMKP